MIHPEKLKLLQIPRLEKIRLDEENVTHYKINFFKNIFQKRGEFSDSPKTNIW